MDDVQVDTTPFGWIDPLTGTIYVLPTEQDADGYWIAWCEQIDGCVALGRDEAEALNNCVERIQRMIRGEKPN